MFDKYLNFRHLNIIKTLFLFKLFIDFLHRTHVKIAYFELSGLKVLRIKVFLTSYIFEFLRLKNDGITHVSTVAKTNYLIFGIYRFLMQGTFIGIIVRDFFK